MRPEQRFASRLNTIFGEPKTDDVAGFLAEYVNTLRGQSGPILDLAADIIVRQRKFRSWPTVAECLDAVASAKVQAKGAAIGLEPIQDFDGWWNERMARIKNARSEGEIRTEIAMIEPYARAQWIFPHRLTEANTEADLVRQRWSRVAAAERAERMMGEANEAP